MKQLGNQNGFIGEIVLLLIALGFVAYVLIHVTQLHQNSQIRDYKSCAAAGYPVLLTYPQTCRTPDGRTFTSN